MICLNWLVALCYVALVATLAVGVAPAALTGAGRDGEWSVINFDKLSTSTSPCGQWYHKLECFDYARRNRAASNSSTFQNKSLLCALNTSNCIWTMISFQTLQSVSYTNGQQHQKTSNKKDQQAGAEQCQAQHLLWKMLLEELDSDQLWCLSLNRYWAILWLNYSSLKVLRAKLETWKFGFWSKYMDQHWIKWYWSNVDQKYWLIFHQILLTKLHR